MEGEDLKDVLWCAVEYGEAETAKFAITTTHELLSGCLESILLLAATWHKDEEVANAAITVAATALRGDRLSYFLGAAVQHSGRGAAIALAKHKLQGRELQKILWTVTICNGPTEQAITAVMEASTSLKGVELGRILEVAILRGPQNAAQRAIIIAQEKLEGKNLANVLSASVRRGGMEKKLGPLSNGGENKKNDWVKLSRMAILVAIEKLKTNDLESVLWDAADYGDSATVQETIRTVAMKLEEETLGMLLFKIAKNSDFEVVQEAITTALRAKLKREEFVSILRTAAKNSSPEATTLVIRAAFAAKLSSQALAQVTEITSHRVPSDNVLKTFFLHAAQMSSEDLVNFIEHFISFWLSSSGVFVTRYANPDDAPSVRRDTILGILKRFRLKDPEDHKKLVKILKSLKFDEPAPA